MGRPRESAERDRDRKLIARLYTRRWHQEDIAAELKLSQATVSRDISFLRKQWEKDAAQTYAKHQAREIHDVNELTRTYWAAWEASKVSTTIRGNDADATVTQKEGAGDSAFLSGVERCTRLRMDLLGLAAAKVVAVVGEDFDQAAWANDRAARHAAALGVLEDPDDGETQ